MIYNNFLEHNQKILHIGACEGEELQAYYNKGIKKVVFVEANPELIPVLEQRCSQYPIETKIYNRAIYNQSNTIIKFNIIYSNDMTNRGCSSVLNLKLHEVYYPHIQKIKEVECQTITIDDILKECGDFNILNMDVQGAELLALQGCSNFCFEYIYTEVALKELYENCCLFDELKTFLENNGYRHIETFMQHETWGDALFKRNDKINV